MRYQLQYSSPEQFIVVTHLIAPFGGSLDMDPELFKAHGNGNQTVVANIPEANAPAFEKVIDIFNLSEYCTKL